MKGQELLNLSEQKQIAIDAATKSSATALKMTHASKASHIGSALSSIDILASLYALKVDSESENSSKKIRIGFSKGHAAAALYAVLNSFGLITDKAVQTYCKDESLLYGHANHLASPAIELSTGSLGHGFPFMAGMAHAAKLKGDLDSRFFVIISDGECDEGTTWETALIANHFKLNNICVVIDRNQIQSLGRTEEVLPLEPLADKWKSFGWKVKYCNGHDIEALLSAFTEFEGPLCLIANTVKGSGVSFMEDSLEWHYKSPNDDELALALEELKNSGNRK
jgi:transketolase